MDSDLEHMYRNPAGYRDRDLMHAAEERDCVHTTRSGSHVTYAKPGWLSHLTIQVGIDKNGTKRAIIRQLEEAERAW